MEENKEKEPATENLNNKSKIELSDKDLNKYIYETQLGFKSKSFKSPGNIELSKEQLQKVIEGNFNLQSIKADGSVNENSTTKFKKLKESHRLYVLNSMGYKEADKLMIDNLYNKKQKTPLVSKQLGKQLSNNIKQAGQGMRID